MGGMDTKQATGFPDALARRLDALEAELPALIQANPDPAGFWEAFLAVADPLEEQAGAHQAVVRQRIASMLAAHGRFLVGHPIEED